MKRRAFLAFTALPLLAACGSDLAPTLTQAALAGIGNQNRLTFSAITVTTRTTAYDSLLARDYSTRLGTDLKAALEAELAGSMSPAGLPLTVELSRLGVAGIATSALGEGRSELAGQIRVNAANGQVYARHDVTAAVSNQELLAGALLGGGLSGGEAVYRRLIADFAEDTREALLGREGIGTQIIRGMTD